MDTANRSRAGENGPLKEDRRQVDSPFSSAVIRRCVMPRGPANVLADRPGSMITRRRPVSDCSRAAVRRVPARTIGSRSACRSSDHAVFKILWQQAEADRVD
jgi:hypothetical protein